MGNYIFIYLYYEILIYFLRVLLKLPADLSLLIMHNQLYED